MNSSTALRVAERILELAMNKGASEVRFTSGSEPLIRVDGVFHEIAGAATFSRGMIDGIVTALLPPNGDPSRFFSFATSVASGEAVVVDLSGQKMLVLQKLRRPDAASSPPVDAYTPKREAQTGAFSDDAYTFRREAQTGASSDDAYTFRTEAQTGASSSTVMRGGATPTRQPAVADKDNYPALQWVVFLSRVSGFLCLLLSPLGLVASIVLGAITNITLGLFVFSFAFFLACIGLLALATAELIQLLINIETNTR